MFRRTVSVCCWLYQLLLCAGVLKAARLLCKATLSDARFD